jgi:serine/threonine protein kinase
MDYAHLVLRPFAEQPLHDVIPSNLSNTKRAVVLRQVLEGLHHYHDELGWTHRDIKPQNIALASLDPVKAIILDVGSTLRSQTSTDHFAGTVLYLAPEVMALKNGISSKPYTSRVDLWSVGVCAWQLFTKTRLFRDIAHPTLMVSYMRQTLEEFMHLSQSDLDTETETALRITLGLIELEPESRMTASTALSLFARDNAHLPCDGKYRGAPSD